MATDNPTDRQRISPIGILLFVLLFGGLLFWGFLCTQRGGDSNGLPGSSGPEVPERLTEEEVN